MTFEPPKFPSSSADIVLGKDIVKEEESIPVKEEPEHIKILREYGNQESNIPINSPYWRLRP